MELREYFRIIKKHSKTFLGVSAGVFLGALLSVIFRPPQFDTSLTLNITRLGSQVSDEYKYDDFYRMQADEKFAETIVEWLRSPRVVEDIYADAGMSTAGFDLKKLENSLKAEKRSAQVVAVNFSASDQKSAEIIARSISKIISQNIQKLNQNQKENTWFEIVAGSPVIRAHKINALAVPVVLVAGIFLAFLVVLWKHYWE